MRWSPGAGREDGYYDIVAETDGLITQVEPMAGEAAVQEGDTVARSEVLISGVITMEPPKYSDLPVRTYQTARPGQSLCPNLAAFSPPSPSRRR